ncbi:MAG: molybdenum cofactor biosynthesis protein MoaE [Chthoniobacterales bacterium]|nr:molybdenum cofactor biosynthesis protein MoaE [Chthoniobacterales bacterium]
MAISNSLILITHAPLLPPPNEWETAAGAVVDFWGVVRALEDGREISGIEYEAHEQMARHQMEILATQAQEKFSLEAVILQHRIGFVATGEASLFLRSTSRHRAAAFAGSEWIIAELKKRVPIWKRPLFVRQEEAPPRVVGR